MEKKLDVVKEITEILEAGLYEAYGYEKGYLLMFEKLQTLAVKLKNQKV